MARRIRNDDGLSQRKKQILRSVIESHIASGEPIGSKALLESTEMSYSSATIRNEMAELEKMGYLEQLHTSSGRVPTALGYRFYVDGLMEDYKLTASEIITLNNMMRSKTAELDTILQNASRLVASITNYTSLAMRAGSAEATVSKYSYMKLGDFEFLLVMRMNDGTVKSANIKTDIQTDDEILTRLTDALNALLVNVSPDGITLPMIMETETRMGMASGLVSPVIKAIYEAAGRQRSSDIRFAGIDNLLEYPEFASKQQMKRVIGMIEDKDNLIKLVSNADDDRVNIYIGDDSGELTSKSALIFRRLSVGGKVVGAIGVLGPCRMDYSKVVSTVEYLSEQISGIFAGNALPEKKTDTPESLDTEKKE